MVGNPADAEDLLQEIFLAAHRKLDGFRGESALGTWLYRLATNHCLDYLRSRAARTNQLTDGLDDEPGRYETGRAGLAEQAVTKMDLERALAQLPEGCRAAFVLHVDEVENDDPAKVAQAYLTNDLLDRFQVRLDDGVLEPAGPLADVAPGVHVDGDQGFGLVDDQVAA